ALTRDLDVGPLALGEDADGIGRVLRLREQDLVVVRRGVIGAVEDPGVEPVIVDAEIEDPQGQLLRRAEGLRQIAGPTGCGHRRGAGEGRLKVKSGWVVELESEGANE